MRQFGGGARCQIKCYVANPRNYCACRVNDNANNRQLRLTQIFNGGYDQLEAVRVRSPSVSHILQRDVVRPRVHRPQVLLRVSAGQVELQTRINAIILGQIEQTSDSVKQLLLL